MSTVISTLPSAKPSAGQTSGPWFAQLLASADIHLNGSRPWDIQIKHPHTLSRIMREGSLGLGESYMDGWWECPAIDQMMTRMVRARLHEHLGTPRAHLHSWLAQWTKRLPVGHSRIVGRAQYAFSNQLFAAMLDTGMNHGSACWDEGASSLKEAQEAKMAQICRKLKLQPGMRLLDIGCGWGSFLRYAAKHHGVQAVGLTHSPAQMHSGQSLSQSLPVQIEVADFRHFNADGRSRFDVVVSLGLLNTSLQSNNTAFFAAARRSLKKTVCCCWRPWATTSMANCCKLGWKNTSWDKRLCPVWGNSPNMRNRTLSLKMCTTWASTMTARCWPGINGLKQPGRSCGWRMTNVFTGCGATTCWPVQAVSAHAARRFGKCA